MLINADKMLVVLDTDWVGFPTKRHLIHDYCRPFTSWFAPVKEYRSCLKGFQKTLFLMVMNKIRKTHKMYCEKEDKTNEMIRHLKCANVRTTPKIRQVMDKVVAYFEAGAKMEDPHDMIPGLCCGALHLIPKARMALKDICFPITRNSSTPEFFVNMTFDLFSDIFAVLCGLKYTTIEECQSLQPKITTQMRDIIDEGHPSGTPLLEHFLTILSRMDESLPEKKVES